MTLLGQLSTLESAGLIQVAQVAPELEYLFRHALVQEVVYASLLKADRRRLHRAVGDAVEQIYVGRLEGLAAALGLHFERAGEEERALKYYTQAGRAALASYANQEAESHHRSALALPCTDAQRADLLSGLGEALFGQSRFGEAIEVWREGIALYRTLGDSGALARLYARSARAAWYGGDTPKGLALCQEGLAAVEGVPESPQIAQLVHEAARAFHFNGVPDQALRLCRQALEMAERLGAVEVQADALATLGVLPDQPPEEAVVALNRAVDLAESAGLLHIATRAHHNMGVVQASLLGNGRVARQHNLRAAEIARQRGVVQEEIFSLVSAAGLSLSLGELTAAEGMLKELETLVRAMPDPGPGQLSLLALEAALLTYRGEFGEALRLWRRCQEEARRRGDLQTLLEASANLGAAFLERSRFDQIEDWTEAESAIAEAIAISDRGIGSRVSPRCLLGAVRIVQGKLDDGRCLLAEAQAEAGPRAAPGDEAILHWLRARLAAAEERWAEALAEFDTAAKIMARLGVPLDWARMVLDWVDAYISRAEPAHLERARTLLREAQVVFEGSGAAHYVEQTEVMLQTVRAKTYAQALAYQKAAEELASAGTIQEGLLPEEIPSIAGWQLAARLEPARETSGDFYDLIPLPDGKVGILVADVADKGAGAALYMALSRTLVRTYARDFPTQPERVLAAVNDRILTETHTDMFVTLFFGVLDPASGCLIYANAGHNPPYHFGAGAGARIAARGSAAHRSLDRTGPPLGILEEAEWEQAATVLSPGDVLVLYTDGVTEAEDEQGAFFGSDRLLEVVQANLDAPAASAQGILDAVIGGMRAFVGKAPRYDDTTLVVLVRDPTDR